MDMGPGLDEALTHLTTAVSSSLENATTSLETTPHPQLSNVMALTLMALLLFVVTGICKQKKEMLMLTHK